MDTNDPPQLGMLRDVSRKPLTPEQQLEAVKKVQSQAEQRVKLGMQLFKAAESRINAQQDLVDQFRRDQDRLREQVMQDVAKTLQDYDQWVGRIDESFTHAIQRLESRMDALDAAQAETQEQLTAIARRSEAMLDHARRLMEQAIDRGSLPSSPAPTTPAAAALLATAPPSPPAADDVVAPPASAPVPVMERPAAPAPPEALPPQAATPPPAAPTPPRSLDELTSTEQERVYSQLLERLGREADDRPANEAA